MTMRLLLPAVLCTLLSSSAAAAPPPPPRRAEALHREAIRHAKKRHFDEAARRWREADRIHPHWKYVLNLAIALPEIGDWLGAWEACERASALAPPANRHPVLQRIRERVRTVLAKDHALIRLRIRPEGATVLRNGVVWGAPRRTWVREDESHLQVTQPGYRPVSFVWRHAMGAAEDVHVLVLRRAAQADSRQGRRAELKPRREAYPGAAPRPDLSEARVDLAHANPTDTKRILGWIGIGTGAAALAVGVALFVHADGLSDEADELNVVGRAAPTSWDTYSGDFDAIDDRYTGTRVGAFVLTGVAAALSITGTVLLLLDATDEGSVEAPASPSLAPLPLRGGGGLLGKIRF